MPFISSSRWKCKYLHYFVEHLRKFSSNLRHRSPTYHISYPTIDCLTKTTVRNCHSLTAGLRNIACGTSLCLLFPPMIKNSVHPCWDFSRYLYHCTLLLITFCYAVMNEWAARRMRDVLKVCKQAYIHWSHDYSPVAEIRLKTNGCVSSKYS